MKWNELETKIRGEAKTKNNQYSADQNASINPEFNGILSNIGTLNDRHDNLKDLVDNLRVN